MRVNSLSLICAIGICLMLGANFLASPASASKIEANVDLHPDTLNLKAEGKWVTAYIELPEGYNASDVDISTILLDNEIPVETNSKYGFVKNPEIADRDDNGIPELMVKFPRSAVIDHVLARWSHVIPFPERVELTITGVFIDGETTFEGVDTVRAKHTE
mgnify:CR=1 FL=1